LRSRRQAFDCAPQPYDGRRLADQRGLGASLRDGGCAQDPIDEQDELIDGAAGGRYVVGAIAQELATRAGVIAEDEHRLEPSAASGSTPVVGQGKVARRGIADQDICRRRTGNAVEACITPNLVTAGRQLTVDGLRVRRIAQ
jgi:hypothetical protein